MGQEVWPNGLQSRRRLTPWIAGLLLAVQAGLLAWCAWQDSPTVDEVAHLPAGISHWTKGKFDLFRVNPPLVRMVAALPVIAAGAETDWNGDTEDPRIRAESKIGRQFLVANGERSFELFTLARWACIPFSILGGCICFRWADELYGPKAALVATALWCFSPNIIGNAHLLTPDAPAASMGAAAGYLLWRWLRKFTWSSALGAGTVLGLAELTKSTWVILFMLWPVLWLLWNLFLSDVTFRTRLRSGAQLIFLLLVGLSVINLGYGFVGSFERLGRYRFVSEVLGGPGSNRSAPDANEVPLTADGTQFANTGNRFATSWLGELPVPLPRDFVQGTDVQKAFLERGLESYLRGEWRKGGWWYFYLYALAVKVPLGIWMLLGLAIISRFYLRPSRASFRDELVVLAPFILLLTFVSCQTGFTKHLRYILPIFPFAFIWISQAANLLTASTKWLSAFVTFALVWCVTSSLWIYPHSLSYFNELAGGPLNGHFHLISSNVDSGQDLLRLRSWLQRNQGSYPLYAHWIHENCSPKFAGIEFLPIPTTARDEFQFYSSGAESAWFAVNVSLLHSKRFEYFLRFQPTFLVGYTIYIFRLTPDEVSRARRETAQLHGVDKLQKQQTFDAYSE